MPDLTTMSPEIADMELDVSSALSLRAALDRLPPRQRAAIVLRYSSISRSPTSPLRSDASREP